MNIYLVLYFGSTYEQRDFDKTESTYYQNTGYSVGSFALGYETKAWNNLKLTSKFRAYKTIFEDDKHSTTSHGTGDASERFYEDGNNKTVDIEELYLTFTPSNNISIKAGRQFISSHWVNKTNDAVKIDVAFGDTSVEAIWAMRHGRVYSRDYRPMTRTNEKKGVYQVALTHKFNDMISATAYDYVVPTTRSIYGGKFDLALKNANVSAHYATNKEKDNSTESSLIHYG